MQRQQAGPEVLTLMEPPGGLRTGPQGTGTASQGWMALGWHEADGQRKAGTELSQICNIVKDRAASRARVPGFESQLCPLLAV